MRLVQILKRLWGMGWIFCILALVPQTVRAQIVSLMPATEVDECLMIDTLWITFDLQIQDVEAAYFTIGYDETHVTPLAVIKRPEFDSGVFLSYTIHPADSINISMGFLIGNFDGPGAVAGVIVEAGVNLTSSPVDILTSELRDPDNAAISHSAIGATITTFCCCRFQGDFDTSGTHDIVDVVNMIDYAFRGAAAPVQDPGCPANRGMISCDDIPDIIDVISLINVAFRSGDEEVWICNPCECSPFPSGCP